MILHGIKRTLVAGWPGNPPKVEVCVGSSPLTGSPCWAVLSDEPACQPLLMRQPEYARVDVCIRLAGEEAKFYVYELYSVVFEGV